MPGPPVKRDILDDLPGAANQQMRGHPQMRDARVVGVRGRVQRVGEELGDALRAELPRREADAMDDDQREIVRRLAVIAIGAGDEPGDIEPVVIDLHRIRA